MNEQEQFWIGEFGDAYTKRNRVDWRARIPFWKHIIDITGARSAFEFGCGAGWNLSAIEAASDSRIALYGYEINELASAITTGCQLNVGGKLLPADECMPVELAFTTGVLIHIAPEHLESTMQRMVDASCDYVLAAEYDADTEIEIEYRGEAKKLWKRPYGKLYESMGLVLVDSGKPEGFNDCTYWLLRKP